MIAFLFLVAVTFGYLLGSANSSLIVVAQSAETAFKSEDHEGSKFS